MAKLYHGSAYLTKPLRPGFYYTRKLVRWDKTESNKFLYATTIKQSAIDISAASLLEKIFDVHRYQITGRHVTLTLYPGSLPYSVELMKDKLIYLYELDSELDGWVQFTNEFNNFKDEWKTPNTVRTILSVNEVLFTDWLRTVTFVVKHVPPKSSQW